MKHKVSIARGKIVSCLLLVVVLIFSVTQLRGTHNRAGEITYEQIGDLTIRATIVTYTKTSSFAADRDSLILFWGDGDSTALKRVNGNGFELPNDIKRNEYVGEHTYPTRGTYKLSLTDPNRIAGILNVDFPNSVNIRFYIETTLTLLEPRFQGRNNSATLLQPPIDFACAGQIYTYNPNAYDKDGDSLSYQLITPFAREGVEVPNYDLPDRINPGGDNMIDLDPITGNFTWSAPQSLGEYNITYRINEYRNGLLINSIVRDMQILVRACPDDNNTPQIEAIDELCVIAGELIDIELLATDIDSNELLTITASGGPFELDGNAADLSVDPSLPISQLNGQISWQTTCEDISEEYYQIVVRVTDEASRPQTGLAALRTIRIKVTGPAPEGVEALNENNVATISWDKPYECDDASMFRGFSVWRRLGSSTIDVDTCRGGLEGMGFERVVFLTNEMIDGRYVAQDAELDPGQIYCYRVIAEYAQITPAGNAYNQSQSLASSEACIRSSGEKPLITNVSINRTDVSQGALSLRWINPDASAIDTTILIGPYGLEVKGAPNLSGVGLQDIRSFDYDFTFGEITDDSLDIAQLNTRDGGFSYTVSFRSGDGGDAFIAESDIASSIFLAAVGSDKSVALTWEEHVPWNNFLYFVYGLDSNGEPSLIDSTSTNSIVIQDLDNGTEYCFFVRSNGKYGLDNITEPLVNDSNDACASPADDVAPCSPDVEVSSLCEQQSAITLGELENTIRWNLDNFNCPLPNDDISSYLIYYAPTEDMPLNLLAEVDAGTSEYIHTLEDNIAGCYVVSATDQSGNESEVSTKICIDNCPSYILPNTFTPNDDQANDVFVPRLNRFIERVEFKVFNRWGAKVFETNDPQLNWSGAGLDNKALAEGTYYYTCSVFEKRVDGITEGDLLRGTVQLIR